MYNYKQKYNREGVVREAMRAGPAGLNPNINMNKNTTTNTTIIQIQIQLRVKIQ